ncbi:MAG: sialidase family protein [Bacteroidota bacterium]
MKRLLFLPFALPILFAGCAAPQTDPADEPAAASDPVSIDLPTQWTVETTDAEAPTIASDGEAVYAVWEDEGSVYLSRYEGNERSEPVLVGGAGDVRATSQAPAQVATGPDGTVYVAWVRSYPVEGRRFPASELFIARSIDSGTSFEPALNIEPTNYPSSHTFYDLAVGGNGNVYLSWLDTRERDGVRARQQASAGTNTPITLAADRTNKGLHDHHVQHARHEAGTNLRVARSIDGGRTFEPSVKVAEKTCQCCRTAITAGADGEVFVAWRHIFPGSIRDMALVRSTDGGATFSEPVRIAEDGWKLDGCPHTGPALAVDGQGRLHAAWYTGAEGGSGVFTAYSDDLGDTFSAPVQLSDARAIAQVRLVRAGGTVYGAWEDTDADVIRTGYATGDGRFVTHPDTLTGATPAATAHGADLVVARVAGGVVVSRLRTPER